MPYTKSKENFNCLEEKQPASQLFRTNHERIGQSQPKIETNKAPRIS